MFAEVRTLGGRSTLCPKSISRGPIIRCRRWTGSVAVGLRFFEPAYTGQNAGKGTNMATMLEVLKLVIEGTLPPPPVAVLLGFQLTEIEAGRAVVEFEASAIHANPMGTLHGGVLCDIADAAMGMAYGSRLPEDESFTTLELKINFVRPFWAGKLRAVGRVVHAGRTVGLTECDITDEQERLIARVSSTCMTLREDMAKGR